MLVSSIAPVPAPVTPTVTSNVTATGICLYFCNIAINNTL